MSSALRTIADNFFHGASRTVGFPLYRLLAVFVLPPSFLQLFYWEVPESVQTSTPSWYDAFFIILQIIGALLVVISLSMKDTEASNHIESVGVSFMAAVGFGYFIAAWIAVGPRPPLTQASWMQLAFSIFCVIRWFQLKNEREKFAEKLQEVKEADKNA